MQPFQTTTLQTVGLLLVQDRRLLLAYSNNKQCFYLPGGKVDAGEDPKTALCREIEEELNIRLEPSELDLYTHITAPAFGEKPGIVMEQDCFFVHRPLAPVASAEIGRIDWFTLNSYLLEPHQAPGAIRILELLQAEGLID